MAEGLESLLAGVDRAALRAADPVGLVHRYADPHDQEVAGLVVAALAYGRVSLIRAAAEAVLERLGASPAAAVEDEARLALLSGFAYRFQRGDDLPRFLGAVGRVRRRHGSLAAAFAEARRESDRDHADPAARLIAELRAEAGAPLTYGLRYLLPDPATGGASKRLHLYLRWMLRGPDGLDLGAWKSLVPGLGPSRLLVPIDTHVSRICRHLGLTERRADDLETARELTAALARLDPADPVRFDMALCHLGISGRCPRQPAPATCSVCPLRLACRTGKSLTPWP